MRSNKEILLALLEGAKKTLENTLTKAGSIKLPLHRLTASTFARKSDKKKALKEKYSCKRIRKSTGINNRTSAPHENQILRLTEKLSVGSYERFSQITQKISGISPKFSFDKLSVPRNLINLNNWKVASVAGILILAIGAAIINFNASVDAYAVEVNGQLVATVTEKGEAEKLLSDLKAEKANTWKRKVEIVQQLRFKETQSKKYQIDSIDELKKKLDEKITFTAVATAIKINGQNAVLVEDAATAQKVLEDIKDSVKTEGVKLDNIAFAEKVEIVDVPSASLKELLPADKAVEVLKQGKTMKKVHVVKEGDSLWGIARANDMRVKELLEANPSIKGEHLALGQEINLVALEPMITVTATGEKTVKEKIPYKVVVETDNSLWRGREKVKVQGENGEREVTYKLTLRNGDVAEKKVVNEKILKTATNKVVVRGAKFVVASRSTGGKVGWPISGRITSNYGRRWGGHHTGLDIDGYTGQPVGAAASGKVVFAGRDGSYGKMVTIRHDNGLVTRYAHLSKIDVSVGDHVDRGDLIGLVGSTGRSTGSHLHFEVISGGSFQNPIKYLK